jgi:hypothetical protein
MHAIGLILSLAMAVVLLAACGASAATQPPASADGGGGGGGSTQLPASDQPAATVAGGSSTHGGGAGQDVAAAGNALVPPHSTEVTRTVAGDTWFVMYESTDSVDSLKAFYADAVPKAGLTIFSTSTVNGGVSYVIATAENGSFGGAVNIVPTGAGKTAVQVTIGRT